MEWTALFQDRDLPVERCRQLSDFHRTLCHVHFSYCAAIAIFTWSSRETPKYVSTCSPTRRNTGAATTPPHASPCGSSMTMIMANRGASAGTKPTNDPTDKEREQVPVRGATVCPVPVLPATRYPGIAAFIPVPFVTTPSKMVGNVLAVSGDTVRRLTWGRIFFNNCPF